MKKHKFSWIDALVIAVIVLLIAGSCYKFFSNDSSASVTQQSVDFQCQLKISGVRSFTTDALKTGDAVYDSENGTAIGVISDIVITPASNHYKTSDGQMILAETEGRYDILLTLDCSGVWAGSTYKNGTYTYFVNQKSTFNTKYSTWTGTIISID